MVNTPGEQMLYGFRIRLRRSGMTAGVRCYADPE